jgi:mRNA interferase RelE/StbE
MAPRRRLLLANSTTVICLPPTIQSQVRRKIDEMGLRLAAFPHFRMTGSDKYRLRMGDYRVIYRFDLARGEIYLVAIGHRREIYRET